MTDPLDPRPAGHHNPSTRAPVGSVLDALVGPETARRNAELQETQLTRAKALTTTLQALYGLIVLAALCVVPAIVVAAWKVLL